MPQARAGAELVERPAGRFESRALRLEQRVARLVGGAEVRVDRIEREVRAREQLRQRPAQVVVAEAEAIHAGIDLEVIAQRRAALRGAVLQRVAGGRARDRRRQVVIEHAVEIADAERAEDQDRRANAGLAEIDAFFDVRHRQHRRARGFECRRDAARAVTVGVGLDDGDDAGAIAGPRPAPRFSPDSL